MKYQLYAKSAVTLGLSILSGSLYASHIIYGLKNAEHFQSKSHSKTKEAFYIQLGSFDKNVEADKLRASFKNFTQHPVLIIKKNNHYKVMVGPIHSASSVRKVAWKLDHSAILVSKPIEVEVNQLSLQNRESTPKVMLDKDSLSNFSNRWFAGLGAAWMEPFSTNATNFASSGMPGFPEDRYSGTGTNGAGQYSIFAGYQWQRAQKIIPAYSLSFQYTYTNKASVNGFIYINNLDDSRSFTYQYDISQQLPMAKLKIDLYRWNMLMPYVSGALGVAINRGHNYSDAPIPGATFYQRRYGFNSGTTTQFAGTFGLGIDYLIINNAQISLGYELSGYGKIGTGRGQGTLSNNKLYNRINANAVVLQAAYLFNV